MQHPGSHRQERLKLGKSHRRENHTLLTETPKGRNECAHPELLKGPLYQNANKHPLKKNNELVRLVGAAIGIVWGGTV